MMLIIGNMNAILIDCLAMVLYPGNTLIHQKDLWVEILI